LVALAYIMAEMEFWYEFASTYSYPAAMRIEAAPTWAKRI
jgi:hypothetical protein